MNTKFLSKLDNSLSFGEVFFQSGVVICYITVESGHYNTLYNSRVFFFFLLSFWKDFFLAAYSADEGWRMDWMKRCDNNSNTQRKYSIV